MFSYNDFKSKVRKEGLALQNRFYINIGLPTALSSQITGAAKTGTNDRDIMMMCKSVSLPGVNINTSPIRYTGESFEAPYGKQYSPCSLVFFVDHDMLVRRFFDDWMNLIQDRKTRNLGWFDEFKSPELSIHILDKQENEVYNVVLIDAVPKSIGTLSLDQESNGFMHFDVTFEYRNYKTNQKAVDFSNVQSGSSSSSSLTAADFYNKQSSNSENSFNPAATPWT